MSTPDPLALPTPFDAPLDAPPDTPAPPLTPPGPPPLSRLRAVGEVVLCSSYPTQILAATGLALAGVRAETGGGLNPTFVVAMAFIDAVLVLGLIVWLMRRRGESVSALLVGQTSFTREALFGLGLVFPVTVGVGLVVALVRVLAPSLHNLPENPLTTLMTDPARVAAFALVVVFAGGVREEIQRAFQLHRLAPGVLPRWPALLVTAVAFGFGHTVQGYDVAVATGLLGALWGALFLVRGSIVAPAVCHALFNLGQVAAAWWVSRAGVSV
ncbi:MAG: CPBP family intramembrane glutamic endopeptidase [Vicinamibacterales bacterium]